VEVPGAVPEAVPVPAAHVPCIIVHITSPSCICSTSPLILNSVVHPDGNVGIVLPCIVAIAQTPLVPKSQAPSVAGGADPSFEGLNANIDS